jgi:hypothetical protein
MECGGPLYGPRWLAGTVAGGPEKGRNVYDKFSGPLGQQQAGFGGQQAGSQPSFTVLGCRCTVAGVTSALRRLHQSQGSCRFGARWASSQASCWSAIAGHVALLWSRRCSSNW